MSDFCKVIIIGRLTKDVETTFTGTGTEIGKTGVAYSKGFGEHKKTVFADVTMWSKTANFAKTYFKKGDPILIEGHLDFDQWESKEGEKRSKLYITAEKVNFAGGTKKEVGEEPKAEAKKAENQPTVNEEDIPF